MAYGMDQLRKAGKAISDFDTAYANKISEGVKANMAKGGPLAMTEGIRGMTSGIPIKDIYNRPDNKPENAKEYIENAGYENAVMLANVASRYALPAGGVTLAGKALIDLTSYFGGPADQQEPGQLSM